MENIVFTQLFRDLVRLLDRQDIINLCKVNMYFNRMCKLEKNFIKRELQKRVFYVQLISDPDEIEDDWVHNIKITKTRPVEMYGDFIETKRFERLDWGDVSEMYVVFHFTDYNTDTFELFSDKNEAEQFFNKGVSDEQGRGIYEGDDNGILYYTVYDDDDTYGDSRWVIQRVNVSE
jgi:hypothetical protein